MKEFILRKFQKIIELLGPKKGNAVLMVHSISQCNHPWYEAEYTLSPEHFFQMIMCLKTAGKQFVLPDELCDKKNCILLTFDDALKDIYIYAYPYLKKLHIPYIVFQAICFFEDDRYLNKENISEMLLNSNMELGSHTINHKNLSSLKKYEVFKELKESKNILEEQFGIKITSLAYPYGSLWQSNIREWILAQKAGYQYAFSTISKKMRREKYNIPRYNVNDNNWKEIVQKIL